VDDDRDEVAEAMHVAATLSHAVVGPRVKRGLLSPRVRVRVKVSVS